MASTSSNNPSPVSNNNVCKYDVFLSFRGETRQAFTDHLYKALVDAGLIPFRDNDDIERGEDLQPEIERGIRESRASIVVLSELYATSRWCLDELCLILEQATKRRHFVLPIFYHVVPSHVKKQKGSFEINVKRDTKWTEDNVERWKAALTRVGNIHGEVLDGPETKFLEKVVGIIEKRLDLKKVYHKANLVGMDTWRKEIDNWLEKSSAQILAVWGMGGNGKTTLARHIVYSNWENFGSISILEDIGSKSAEQLQELQKKLLRDILQGKKRKVPSVWQGTCKIENALKTEKALIVLDNIVEPRQLFDLLGTGIETQCKIIITTRESNPHKWFDQSTSWRCQELEMKSLDMNDSLELLSLHAFGSKAPTEGYGHLVEKALWYCEGNPLALEVLGSSLSQNNKQLWESRLNAFEKELHARIHIVLIGSYESLPLDSDRDLFLHIACFFVGKDIDYVVKILEPDYSALSGIETLFKSCLVSVSPNKKLIMHRMLQEMARKIVYKESPKNPAKRSRVWRDEESYDILQQGKGSKKIEGMALDIKLLNQGKESYEYESSNLTTESFKKMDKLKLLQLNSVDLTGPYESFSKQLRWICWTGFSLRAIPSNLCMKNLVAIDMSYSCLEEFEPPADLLSLKILNLRSSKDLREIRNIDRLRYLEILILWDCRSLTHVTLGGLTCLAILNLTGCKRLCRREEISPLVSEEGLFHKIKRKPSQEGSSIHATKSTQHASFLLPQSLERLYLMNCNLSDTDYFPLTFKDQPLLIYLNLVNSPFEHLPSYNYLKRLRVLDVSGCSDLKELQCLPSTLAELYIYYCNSLNIVAFESHRFTLQEFGYEGCINLCEVEGLFKLMPVTKLEESDLKHMTWLREYQDLTVCLVGDAELTKGRSSCVQMLYEFNIMSTSLPNIKNSNMMTDTDYMYTSQSTLLSFKVPACPNHRRLEGLIITFQYTAHGEDWVWFTKISTPSGVNLMYNPRVFGKPDEVGMWSSYWPIGKALQIEETVTVSIVVIKGLLDIHWCGARLVYTDEAANEHLQENKECVAILGEDFSEFQLSTGAYYLCRRDFFELMEAGKLTPDWFSILVDDKINYTEVGGWRMTGKPEHPYQSYTEVKTIKCIMYGPEMDDFYKIAELSKSSLVDKTKESTSVLSKAIPKSFAMQHSSHHFPFGPSKITSMNYSKAVGRGREMLTGSDAYNETSSDTTLFTSSLPVFPHEKFVPNNAGNEFQSLVGNDLLEDLAIGNLLPEEDELLAGVMDGFDLNAFTSRADESEEYDLFGSGGGMELESDMDNLNLGISKVSLGDGVADNGVSQYNIANGVGTVSGEHPYGEHPSRTLFVRNINSNVEDSELRTLFEQYGDIRTLYTACKHRGFVMISYYDIRAARTAMRALQNKPLRRRKLDIHSSIPKDNPSDKDINQGTLVVFNLDPSVSCEDLLQIFGAYGEVKEIRETPHKRHHKFIEYYDVRAAEAALRSLNRSDIAGKRIKLEPSRPGGARRNLMLQLSQEFDQDDTRSFRLQVGPSIANSPPGVWPQFGSPIEHSPLQSLSKSPVLGSISPTFSNNLPGLASILHPQPSRIAPIGKDHERTNRSHLELNIFNGTSNSRPTIAESLAERGRNRCVDQNESQTDGKKQFQLDIDKIRSGEDTRTTLMIKNIPNKYTSKMLLAAIDENHSGTYDFLYLPIDFKNKCNVGYAFINMLSPTHIIPFYQAFNGKKWEKFNSEKVASLAYARIQGKMALVTHFQNSSLISKSS